MGEDGPRSATARCTRRAEVGVSVATDSGAEVSKLEKGKESDRVASQLHGFKEMRWNVLAGGVCVELG